MKFLHSGIMIFFICSAVTGAVISADHSTEIQYLSGRGEDQTVEWEFRCSSGRNSGTWQTIPVPSCWELQGFGTYNYGMDNSPSDETGHYRYQFEVPDDWKEKEIFIVFEGSMTDTDVRINGKKAGSTHRGAFYQFEFNISELLKWKQKNLLEVTVAKRSSDSSVNLAERKADYWVFGGIFRPVYLKAFPKEYIEHSAINARHDGSLAMDIKLKKSIEPALIECRIFSGEGDQVGEVLYSKVKEKQEAVRLEGKITDPECWTAENPALYRAEIRLIRNNRILHQLEERFGFRTVEVREGEGIFVNGLPVKLKGVNRHSFWPESGRTLSNRINRMDVQIIKSMNLNAVRMSHYPPDRYFLDMCDSLGLYVLDELAGWQAAYETAPAKPLVKALVTRDVNHPSILFWDNGNEGGFNYDLVEDYYHWDPQKRAVLHPWEPSSGINTIHYRTYYMNKALADGPHIFMPTEILHGLYDGGHGAGLEDLWSLVCEKKLAAGFFLWALLDEGVVRTDRNGKLDTDGNHGPDGILGPYREKEGSYYTIKDILSPIDLNLDGWSDDISSAIPVQNRYDFTNLKECYFEYGVADFVSPFDQRIGYRQQGASKTANLSVAPHESGELILDLPESAYKHDVLFIRAFDRNENLINTWTSPLKSQVQITDRILPNASGKDIKVEMMENQAILQSDQLEVRVGSYGVLEHIKIREKQLSLSNGPVLIGGGGRGTDWYLYSDGKGRGVEIRYRTGEWQWIRWTLFPNNWLKCEYAYRLHGFYDVFGVTFDYPEEKIKGMKWLGKGPYRVWKNRMRGTTYNVWQRDYNDAVTGVVWEYPEFKGYYADLYWLVVQTQEGDITITTDTEDLFFRMLTPKDGPSPRSSFMTFPKGDISFLHGIPAIGTKFLQAKNLGPQSLENVADDVYTGTLYFHFGEN